MREPTVSIIIPCFNRERMVGEAIESALNQGGKVEVIVIDDGSTDGGWQVISSFKGIVARQIANRGVSAARNQGLALARGNYVKFLDSDDLLPGDGVEAFLDLQGDLRANQIAIGTAIVRSTIANPRSYGFGSVFGTGVIPGKVLLRQTMPCGLPLFPIAALRQAGGFDEALTIGEDYVLAAKLHALGYSFVQYPTPSYIVRDHGEDRLSRRYGADGFDDQLATHLAALKVLGPISREERRAIGQTVWVIGRDASRLGHWKQADALFGLASRLGGVEARVGAELVKLLYRFLSPYMAERIIMLGKRTLRNST